PAVEYGDAGDVAAGHGRHGPRAVAAGVDDRDGRGEVVVRARVGHGDGRDRPVDHRRPARGELGGVVWDVLAGRVEGDVAVVGGVDRLVGGQGQFGRDLDRVGRDGGVLIDLVGRQV